MKGYTRTGCIRIVKLNPGDYVIYGGDVFIVTEETQLVQIMSSWADDYELFVAKSEL